MILNKRKKKYKPLECVISQHIARSNSIVDSEKKKERKEIHALSN